MERGSLVIVRYPWPVDGTRDYAERAAAPNPPRPSDTEVRHAGAGSRLHPGAGALPVPTEADEQRTVAEWLDLLGILWFHVPNEGKRTKAQGALLVALGLKVGVPDNWVIDRPPEQPELVGAVFELKKRDVTQPGPGQAEWLEALASRGWASRLCSGAGEAIAWLEGLGYGRAKA